METQITRRKPGPKPNPNAHTRKPEYWIWNDAKRRCTDQKRANFEYYGGRGIRMCDAWINGEGGLTGFECFYRDMGPRPSPTHSLDRSDNDGPYDAANCRWASKAEQSRNQRRVRVFTYKGVTASVAELCERFGKRPGVVHQRLRTCGWTIEQAMELPPGARPNGQKRPNRP